MQLKQLAVLKRYDKEGIKWVGAIEKEVDDLASSFKDMEKNSQKLQAIYKSFMEYI
jgi:inorganic pyrophosphatase